MTIAAAIDLGSNAIRMTIATRNRRGKQKTLATQRAGIRIGHDVFTQGRVSRRTLAGLEQAMAGFKKMMARLGVQQARAVATSALREARNGAQVARRLSLAGGVPVEVISGLEEAQLIRQAVQGRLNLKGRKPNLLVELGGGSAELSLVQHGDVVFSEMLKIGAVRLLEVLGSGPQGGRRFDGLVRHYCQRLIRRLRTHLPPRRLHRLIGTGGNIEEVANLAVKLAGAKKDRKSGVVRVKAKAFDKVFARLAAKTPEERVRDLGLRRDRADVIEPAAVFYRELMRSLGFKEIWVPFATLREGVLDGLFRRHLPGEWSAESLDQVRAAALQYARRYDLEERHARQVCGLALSLFDQLRGLHHLGGEERLVLEVGAYFHDVGYYIDAEAHHKHSQYLVGLMSLPGFSKELVQKASLVARYHRRSHPKMAHKPFAALSSRERQVVRRLASLVRIADALDRAHKSLVSRVEAVDKGSVLELRCKHRGNLVLERWAVQKGGELFGEVFKKRVVLRSGT